MNRLLGAVLMAGVIGAVSGCGVPSPGPPEPLTAGLGERSVPVPAPARSSADDRVEGQVALVTADGRVRLLRRVVSGGDLRLAVGAVLAELVDGPGPEERDRGLRSSVPPGTSLSVSDVTAGTVTVDLGTDVSSQGSDQVALAVAQIVLSATSVPGVRALVLTRDGRPVDAPLPDGALTTGPLTRSAYLTVLDGLG